MSLEEYLFVVLTGGILLTAVLTAIKVVRGRKRGQTENYVRRWGPRHAGLHHRGALQAGRARSASQRLSAPPCRGARRGRDR